MPYFVYHITVPPGSDDKQLDYQTEFASFREAKQFARQRRAELGPDTDITVKVIFAANRIEAEGLLREKREKPIVMEWEK